MNKILVFLAILLVIGASIGIGWKLMENRLKNNTSDEVEQVTPDDGAVNDVIASPMPTASPVNADEMRQTNLVPSGSPVPQPSDSPAPKLSSKHDESSLQTDLNNTVIYNDNFSDVN